MDSLALGGPLRFGAIQLKREGIFTCWNLKKERQEQENGQYVTQQTQKVNER